MLMAKKSFFCHCLKKNVCGQTESMESAPLGWVGRFPGTALGMEPRQKMNFVRLIGVASVSRKITGIINSRNVCSPRKSIAAP